jgi:hypothetical protein
MPVCGTDCDGGQFIVGQIFRTTSGRQILKLHLFGQNGSNDLEVLVRPVVRHGLDHGDAVGVGVVGQGLQQALA